jgi:AraC-like DNA-binding protein
VDALSDVLALVRLSGAAFLEAEFTTPWCIQAQVGPEDCGSSGRVPAQVIAYHYVFIGRLSLSVAGFHIEAAAGDIVLLPRNDPHVLGSRPGLDPVTIDPLIQPSPVEGGLASLRYGGGGEATRIVCGFIGCDVGLNPLLATLPPVLSFRMRDAAGDVWIQTTLRRAAAEFAGGGAGSAAVLSKLAELLFAEAVRRYLAELPSDRTGWLAGLRDRAVGRSLALLHARLADPWTTGSLAREVGLSRSAFADRFTRLIEVPPMRYLARSRLQAAAARLRDGNDPIGRIAWEVGYESEAAFNRAFKREFGSTPAVWRAREKNPRSRADSA